MIFISIVIPAYNSEKTIIPLLTSIIKSRNISFQNLEVIIVDDSSSDQTVRQAQRFRAVRKKTIINSKIIQLEQNSGPARARNIGVKYARGKIILFLDADVQLFKNTLSEVVSSFKNDPDIHALTGVWSKAQKSSTFFPKFKALRDWSYWINERDPRHYYYLFSTRIAAIDRALFLRLGGFDEDYQAALVEDIELTYRIARRYAVVFNPKVIVNHEFEDFTTVAKKYFWRSFYWSRIYRERKKFDPVATTSKEAVTTVTAALLVILIISYTVLRITYTVLGLHDYRILYVILYTLYVILIIHLLGVRKFLWFVAKEEGLWFAVKSFFTGIALYLVILAGAGISFVLPGERGRRGQSNGERD
jgi:glycosyltransferase involved in cell wall biosynthesis